MGFSTTDMNLAHPPQKKMEDLDHQSETPQSFCVCVLVSAQLLTVTQSVIGKVTTHWDG